MIIRTRKKKKGYRKEDKFLQNTEDVNRIRKVTELEIIIKKHPVLKS
jgi:hypothetical protein